MTTVAQLAQRIAFHAHDPTMSLIMEEQHMSLINDAVRDLRMAGWLLPLAEDESTTMAEDTYEYDVPADFAYIYRLCEQSEVSPVTYDIVVPAHQWRLGLDASADPEIIFNGDLWAPRAGKTIKVIGQKRPVVYTATTETLETEFEGFVRERATALACYFVAGIPDPNADLQVQRIEGDSPSSSGRLEARVPRLFSAKQASSLRLGDIHYALSERMLRMHPQEFRVWPNSQNVPGR